MIDPTTITIPPRQRSEPTDTASLEASIKRNGLIHPIIVRELEGKILLVSGYRRLQACINLKKSLEPGKDIRFWSDLSPREARIIELEENIKRVDLPWRDHVTAIAEIHQIFSETNPDWTSVNTSEETSLDDSWIRKVLMVYHNLDSPSVAQADGINHAYRILQSAAERRTAAIVHEISAAGTAIFEPPPEQADDEPKELKPHIVDPTSPIIHTDFISWAATYDGPKFNLIHCDFPYDTNHGKVYGNSSIGSPTEYFVKEEEFYLLLDALLENIDRIASYQSHIMVWFSMNAYTELLARLKIAGLVVDPYPWIWFKSDNSGIIPSTGGLYSRRTYETALIASRGRRTLIKSLANVYPAPLPNRPIHPSQKSEPMLRHFFSMLIDETTDVLDPTCGSGAAVRAADSLGARSILGIEKNESYFESAKAATSIAMALRKMVK